LQTSVVDSKRISDAEERKDEGDSKRSSNKPRSLRIVGETQNHSPVLCLEDFGVASQKTMESRNHRALAQFSEFPNLPCPEA